MLAVLQRLSIPSATARDGSAFFATSLDPQLYPRANVRVYAVDTFSDVGVTWGLSVAQSTSQLLLGQPQWTDLRLVPHIRVLQPPQSGIVASYSSCAADAGTLLAVSPEGNVVVTTLNTTHLLLLDVSGTFFQEAYGDCSVCDL